MGFQSKRIISKAYLEWRDKSMRDLVTIAKVEFKKLLSRKDTWIMFTILLVPILYSVGLAFESNVITYTGSGSVTAIGFTSAMFQMSQSMFIFNVILSAIIGRSFASEIESKSLRLCINRIGDRRLIYLGKELALLFFYRCFAHSNEYYLLLCCLNSQSQCCKWSFL